MKHLKKMPVILLIVLPAMTFFAFFFKCTINAPINDDYHAVLGFINDWTGAESFSEKAALIFSQHNEHRIVYDRLWTLISYKIHENADFNFLAFIGNLSLVGIAVLLFRKFKKHNDALVLFFPVSVLIFNIASWENMTFAMAGLSNFTVIFFILLSLSFLTRDTANATKNLLFGFLFLFLAVMTQGAGLFLIPVSLLILIYRKAYKHLAIYAVLSVLLLALYFFNYHTPPGNSGIFSVLQDYNLKILLFALAFLGNGFNYVPYSAALSLPATITVGFLIFAWFIYITKKQYYKKNLFNYCVVVFIIIIAFITAIGRVQFGIETAGASRYRIYGLLLLVSVYVWFLDSFRLQKKAQISAVLFISALYWLTMNLNHYQCLYQRERATYTGIIYYNSGDASQLNGDKNLTENYKQILEDAARRDTYHFPENEALESYFPFSKSVVGSDMATNTSLDLFFRIDAVHKLSDSYIISGWTYLKGKSTKNQEIFIGIKNQRDGKTDFYTSNPSTGFSFISFFGKYKFQRGGFDARIKPGAIKPGDNTIVIMIKNDGAIKISETEMHIVK